VPAYAYAGHRNAAGKREHGVAGRPSRMDVRETPDRFLNDHFGRTLLVL
jgi:hypothetical protein